MSFFLFPFVKIKKFQKIFLFQFGFHFFVFLFSYLGSFIFILLFISIDEMSTEKCISFTIFEDYSLTMSFFQGTNSQPNLLHIHHPFCYKCNLKKSWLISYYSILLLHSGCSSSFSFFFYIYFYLYLFFI